MPAKQVQIDGALTIGPIQPTSFPFPSGECNVSLNSIQTVLADLGPRSMSLNSPAAFVDLLGNSGITNLRVLYIRVRAGSITVRLTSPAGAVQVLTISELLLMTCPTSGTEWTALAVEGVADIEIAMAGT